MGWGWLPNGAQMTQRMLALAIAFLLTSSSAVLTAKERGQGKILLVHVTTLLDRDQDRTALVFRVVAAGLKKSQHVILIFDAQGVASLKIGRWFGGHSTPIDRVFIFPQDRKDLAAMLGSAPEEIPDIYGSLLAFLKGRGVEIWASKRALEVAGLWPDRFDQIAEPASEERMLELLGRANAYLAY
jgi:hypothetical protein